MKLFLHREFDSGDDTLGRLYYRDQYQDLRYVYTLEDEYRKDKVKGETRIPEGFYDVRPRKFGRIYEQYIKSSVEEIRAFTQKYGVLEILDVPDFDNILIHVGNKDEDTLGCVLVGDLANNNSKIEGFISDSIKAYSKFISAVGYYIDRGESLRLEIQNFDREIERMI